MKFKISEKRAKFLKDQFFEYSFKNTKLDKDLLNSISEPIELDFIAKNHNYDDGNEILEHIVNNQNCDFSTVKMIFFRSDLNNYLNGKENSQDYKLINFIIKNCENGFYTNENFYYNPTNDYQTLEYDFDEVNNSFPKSLFEKPKGKEIESNFAEKFYKRNISTLENKVIIHKDFELFNLEYENIRFEYSFPKNFETISDTEIEYFINHHQYPTDLQKNFDITDKQLKKVVTNPEFAIQNKSLTIIFFVFNAKPLLLENALTNVATIMRNEFIYLQAFIEIIGVENDFEKIKRIKFENIWFAISKVMQIKVGNLKTEKYFKLVLFEKDGLLFHFSIISEVIENLENETIQKLIIEKVIFK